MSMIPEFAETRGVITSTNLGYDISTHFALVPLWPGGVKKEGHSVLKDGLGSYGRTVYVFKVRLLLFEPTHKSTP